jgi:hypothetical protein
MTRAESPSSVRFQRSGASAAGYRRWSCPLRPRRSRRVGQAGHRLRLLMPRLPFSPPTADPDLSRVKLRQGSAWAGKCRPTCGNVLDCHLVPRSPTFRGPLVGPTRRTLIGIPAPPTPNGPGRIYRPAGQDVPDIARRPPRRPVRSSVIPPVESRRRDQLGERGTEHILSDGQDETCGRPSSLEAVRPVKGARRNPVDARDATDAARAAGMAEEPHERLHGPRNGESRERRVLDLDVPIAAAMDDVGGAHGNSPVEAPTPEQGYRGDRSQQRRSSTRR